jgi:hypothetical protein
MNATMPPTTFSHDGQDFVIDFTVDNDRVVVPLEDVAKVLGCRLPDGYATKVFGEGEIITVEGDEFLTWDGLFSLTSAVRTTTSKPFFKWATDAMKAFESARKKKVCLDDDTKHVNLMNAFQGQGRSIIYLAKLRRHGGKTFVKIGTTRNILEQNVSLVKEYGSAWFFECFDCAMPDKFERFLTTKPEILTSVYRGPSIAVGGRASSNTGDIFLMDDTQIKSLVYIAKRNIKRYNDAASPEQLAAMNEAKARAEPANKRKKAVQPEAEIATPTASSDEPAIRQQAYKVQRYTADGKTLIRTYPGYREASRDKDLDNAVAKGIKDAVEKKTLYKSFRWAILERSLPDDMQQNVGETVGSTSSKRGYVAMLDPYKTHIVKVFPAQQDAAKDRNVSAGAISTAVKNQTSSGGQYFTMWFDCPEDMKQAFLANNSLPEPHKPANGKVIEQTDLVGAIVRRWPATAQVLKEYRMSRNVLFNAINEGLVLKGYKWRFASDGADESI